MNHNKNLSKKKKIKKKPIPKGRNKHSFQRKKFKIRYERIVIFLLLLYFFAFLVYSVIHLKITNLYIQGNEMFTDQEIIELAHLENYPASLKNFSRTIRKRLEKNIYIASAKVSKRGLTKVYIEVTENRPLFYDKSKNKTILIDRTEVDDLFQVPTVINYIPDGIYDNFLEKISHVPIDVLKRISEIKYDPNEVDKERFLLSMSDGNYVYLTLYKFSLIDNYIEIIKKFQNKKGILNLDAGNSFEVLEG